MEIMSTGSVSPSPGIKGAILSVSALILLFALSGCAGEDGSSPPNVLLICIDTLRADHLGCYGYPRPTSPFIDSLAESDGAVLFEQCISQAPNTAPSHATIFTSLHPVVHGIPNARPGEKLARMRHVEETRTLAEIFLQAGFITAGITDGGRLNPAFDFDRGFDKFQCAYEGVSEKVNQAIEWLEENAGRERPFFLFLHTYQVHTPYLPPPPYHEKFTGDYDGWIKDYCFENGAPREMGFYGFGELLRRRKEFGKEDVEYLKALYDGEIAHTDRELERLWRFMRGEGMLDDLLVIILSDHGEEFGEHGEFDHKQLYDEVLHVPLIFIFPPGHMEAQKTRVKEQVSLIDIMPTLLDLYSLEGPSYMQGESMLPCLTVDGPEEARPAFSVYIGFEPSPLMSSVRYEETKYVRGRQNKRPEVYDLEEDRLEKKNRFSRRKDQAERLEDLLERQHARNLEMRKTFKARIIEGEMSPELVMTLKQLGY